MTIFIFTFVIFLLGWCSCLVCNYAHEKVKKKKISKDEDMSILQMDSYYCMLCNKSFFVTTDKKVICCPNCGAKMVEPQESEVNNG